MCCLSWECVCFSADQNDQGDLNRHCLWYIVTGYTSEVTITGLKPETSYELKLSAINGKGEGESSPAEFFKTEPVRKWPMLQSLQHAAKLLSHLFDPCLHTPITWFLSSMSWSKKCLSIPLLIDKSSATTQCSQLLDSHTQLSVETVWTVSQKLPGLSVWVCALPSLLVYLFSSHTDNMEYVLFI